MVFIKENLAKKIADLHRLDNICRKIQNTKKKKCVPKTKAPWLLGSPSCWGNTAEKSQDLHSAHLTHSTSGRSVTSQTIADSPPWVLGRNDLVSLSHESSSSLNGHQRRALLDLSKLGVKSNVCQLQHNSLTKWSHSLSSSCLFSFCLPILTLRLNITCFAALLEVHRAVELGSSWFRLLLGDVAYGAQKAQWTDKHIPRTHRCLHSEFTWRWSFFFKSFFLQEIT